jgi:hypothetical protein
MSAEWDQVPSTAADREGEATVVACGRRVTESSGGVAGAYPITRRSRRRSCRPATPPRNGHTAETAPRQRGAAVAACRKRPAPGPCLAPRRGRGRALRRVRQDDAEGVDETAFGGAWRTDAGQHVTHAAPLSEVAELARGRSASGRAIELDWVFIDPAQRGSSSAAWAGLPRDSIAHRSTTLATKRRGCRTEIEQPLVRPSPRRPGCPPQKRPTGIP